MKENIMNRIKTLWQRCRSGVLLGLALGTLIYIAITATANLSSQTAFAGVSVNLRLSQSGSDWLKQALTDRLKAEDYRGKILLADAELDAFETVEDLDTNYYALQALLLLYETQEVDAMLMDQVAMENFLRQEIYLDLRQLLSEDSLAAMGEAVIWARHKESSEAAPLVLDVTELPFIQDHTEATGRVYLAFMNNTTHLPACRLLWDAITAWEDEK